MAAGSAVQLKVSKAKLNAMTDLIFQVHASMGMLMEDLGISGYDIVEQGNVAIALCQLTGGTAEYLSFSGNSKLSRTQRSGFYSDLCASVATGQKQVQGYEWLSNSGQSNNHTEPKLLVAIQGEFALDNRHKGTIWIISSRNICQTCRGVILRFSGRFPHITIFGIGLQQDVSLDVLVQSENVLNERFLRFEGGNVGEVEIKRH